MRKAYRSLVFLALLLSNCSYAEILETVAQWPLLDFAFPYDPGYVEQFQPENTVPTGLEIGWNRVFIAVPRLRAGVPSTLNFIPRQLPIGSSPRLQAYPSWDWHSAGKGDFNCSKLISVYRVRIDRCNRLWVLDSGINTSIDDFTVACPPKILIFDLQTDRLVRIVSFPRESVRPNSLFTNLVIDDTTATTCDDVYAYITDTTGPGLVVFEGATGRSWRFLHSSMLPHPDQATYRIGRDTFELFDGIVGIAFSPRLATVYYQPLATDRLFSVPTTVLRAGPPNFEDQLPVTLIGRKSSQGIGLSVDPRDDSILFSPLTETAVASWQPQTNAQRILAYSPDKLQFAAEVRWVERDNGNVWSLSSRFHKFFKKQINPRDTNVRILRIRNDEQHGGPNPVVVGGGGPQPPLHHHHHHHSYLLRNNYAIPQASYYNLTYGLF